MRNRNKKQFYTIAFIPHSGDNILSLRLPLFAIRLFGIALIGMLLGSLFSIQTFSSLHKEAAENSRLKQENHALSMKVDEKADETDIWMEAYYGLQDKAEENILLKQENRDLNEKLEIISLETEKLVLRFEELETFSEEVRNVLIDTPLTEEKEQISFLASGDGMEDELLFSSSGNPIADKAALNMTFLQNALPQQQEELELLKKEIEDYQAELNATPSIWPTRGRVTSGFGPRRSPVRGGTTFHNGIDIAASSGTPIYSSADGTVVKAQYNGGYGNTIEIDHGHGYRTMYAHLSGFSVSVGETVEKGQRIGSMGSTGSSTGPHLHYEVHVNGEPVNPRQFLP